MAAISTTGRQLDPVAVALIAGTDQADVDRGVAGQYC
jgi:hypothetical protein